MSPLFCGIPIYTDPCLGETVTPQPPPMPRGPYLQRRIKRWRRAHPSYTRGNGGYFLLDMPAFMPGASPGKALLCHPDDLPRLRQALAEKGLL